MDHLNGSLKGTNLVPFKEPWVSSLIQTASMSLHIVLSQPQISPYLYRFVCDRPKRLAYKTEPKWMFVWICIQTSDYFAEPPFTVNAAVGQWTESLPALHY